ncbi:MAG: tripartite tricarboxylate transporter TctB family protein [Alphaproteobacteria bacterium]|nr:tripartite tricarboxylate transporter TctB family protein [Alphaproteobacteria bacterium]
MSRDLVCAAAALVLAGLYWREADAIPRSLLSDAVGAEGLPKLLAVALATCAVLLAVRAVRRRDGGRLRAWRDHARSLGVIALGAAYVGLAPLLGYSLALALLIAATIVYFGARAPVPIAATAVLGAGALWLIFAKLLSVAMPTSALARWLA